ncbi:MAG: hypothetical protein K0S80_4709 [Neobacillus sp.]|nr:hypothetical protein [Neobacillus sp.]
MIYKHRKWEIITIEILYFGFILAGLIFIFQGINEMDWFYCAFGIGIVIWTILFFRTYLLDVKGYLAVYSNKIVEKKKQCKEVFFQDVTEVRYFKKRIYTKQTWYMDCLQFFVKDQEGPILINPHFKGTVVPHNMTTETMEILTYIRANFPFIKYTKEEWQGTY